MVCTGPLMGVDDVRVVGIKCLTVPPFLHLHRMIDSDTISAMLITINDLLLDQSIGLTRGVWSPCCVHTFACASSSAS
jgi:hypothetical protein